MGYLFGDSTESGLDFNYLAFLREAVDCTVALVECDVTLATVADRKRVREREMETELAAIADIAKRATDLVGPIAKEATAAGRCAAAIATAIREAAERESAAVRAKLAGQRDELDKDGDGVNARAKEALSKLLRTHDLPGAEKELEVTWTSAGVKATMRQRTGFGVEALLALEVPPGSLFTPDLRVERVADGIEVHAREAGGWIKKSDKLVTHRLGRYHITRITIGATVRIQLRADANAGEMTIISPPNGDLMIDASGGGGGARELMIEDRDRAGLRAFVDKLEAATRALAQSRGQLVSIEIDNKSLADQGNARLFAERLTAAMAPTVQKIKLHSRSADELVLRKLLGDNRREETFVPISELVQRFDTLPPHARTVFAPWQLQGEPAPKAPAIQMEPKREAPKPAPALEAPVVARTPTGDLPSIIDRPSDGRPIEIKPVEIKPADKSVDTKPMDAKSIDTKPMDAKSIDTKPMDAKSIDTKPLESKPVETKPIEVKPVVPMPERAGSRTSPPLTAIPEPTTTRTKPPTQPFGAAAVTDAKRAPAPPAQDFDDEEWPSISRDEPNDGPVSSS